MFVGGVGHPDMFFKKIPFVLGENFSHVIYGILLNALFFNSGGFGHSDMFFFSRKYHLFCGHPDIVFLRKDHLFWARICLALFMAFYTMPFFQFTSVFVFFINPY